MKLTAEYKFSRDADTVRKLTIEGDFETYDDILDVFKTALSFLTFNAEAVLEHYKESRTNG